MTTKKRVGRKKQKAAKNEEEGKGKTKTPNSFNRHTPLTWNKLNTSFLLIKLQAHSDICIVYISTTQIHIHVLYILMTDVWINRYNT